MYTTVKTGWLNDSNVDKFAPKTNITSANKAPFKRNLNLARP